MKEHFCYLKENEDKIFIYVEMYYNFLCSNEKTIQFPKNGNRIQIQEIRQHLKNKGLAEGTEEANKEANNWIDVYKKRDKHGSEFRKYLDTIKQIAWSYYITGIKLTFINYKKTINKMNKKKEFMESIY